MTVVVRSKMFSILFYSYDRVGNLVMIQPTVSVSVSATTVGSKSQYNDYCTCANLCNIIIEVNKMNSEDLKKISTKACVVCSRRARGFCVMSIGHVVLPFLVPEKKFRGAKSTE